MTDFRLLQDGTSKRLLQDGASFRLINAGAGITTHNRTASVAGDGTITASSSGRVHVRSAAVYGGVNELWSARHEGGSVAEWFTPGTSQNSSNKGGGFYPTNPSSGDATAGTTPLFADLASTDYAHTGQYSLKLEVDADTPEYTSDPAMRCFRWNELYSYRELTFEIWCYLPFQLALRANPASGRFWNMVQFKSRDQTDWTTAGTGRNDPVWGFYATDDGTYSPQTNPSQSWLIVGWGWGGTTLAGPYSTSGVSGKWYDHNSDEYVPAAIVPFPIGQWFKITTQIRQSNTFDGRVRIWQDDTLLFDFQNVRTSYPLTAGAPNAWGCNQQWSANLYTDGMVPLPAGSGHSKVYFDDARIFESNISASGQAFTPPVNTHNRSASVLSTATVNATGPAITPAARVVRAVIESVGV